MAVVGALCACAVSEPATGGLLATASGTARPSTNADPGLRYVALGDSYTIGTSVGVQERFPEQLVAVLGTEPPGLALVANLGVNGYTSADLIANELPALDGLEPELVTVLIGVNDVVQGVPADRYEANAVTILDALLARLPPERIITVAIPDYTVTPAGADFGEPTAQSNGIRSNNTIMERLAGERGIAFVDIFDISRGAAADRSLVAGDGLHPSGAQYARWVERLVPIIKDLLGR